VFKTLRQGGSRVRMRTKGIFIAGTDTGVGKTLVTGLLARFLSESGVATITQKWIQTGTSVFSDDVSSHLALMGRDVKDIEKYSADVMPYSFKFPSSPHLASEIEKAVIDPKKIKEAFFRLSEDFDITLAEGSGGLMVPVNENVLMVDIVRQLAIPVILVVENRLGAINQAILSTDVLKSRGVDIIGIIFNRLSRNGDDVILEDNIGIVEKISGLKVFGELPFSEDKNVLYKAFLPIGEKILNSYRLTPDSRDE
jgi:dethiobiotin synthetase